MRDSIRMKAYLTVEASIVMPLMILCFTVLMYMTVVVYNKILLVEDSYILLIYARELYRENPKELSDGISRIWEKAAEERPFLSIRNLDFTLKKKKNEIEIKESLEVDTIFDGENGSWFTDKDEKMTTKEKIYLSDPGDIMLISREIMGE